MMNVKTIAGPAVVLIMAGYLPVPALAADCDDAGVVAAREAFNEATHREDPAAIAALLAEDVVLITGTDSEHYRGRDEQLALWTSDDPKDLRYTRTTASVSLSPGYPLAMEQGHWRGVSPQGELVGGEYAAKWRCMENRWQLEAEIFMTTRCTGSLCD